MASSLTTGESSRQRDARDSRGREYRFAPKIGCTNFIMEKGSTPRDRMIEEVDDGVLVTFAVGGGNTSSGEFSADVRNVYRIEGGEITYPIRQAMFAGNMMGLLKNVDAVGDISRTSGGLSPGEIISPSIRTRNGLIIGDLGPPHLFRRAPLTDGMRARNG